MTCSKSTLLKTALIVGTGFLLAYAGIPGFRAWLSASVPLLISLICPLSMLFCVKGMAKQSSVTASPAEANPVGLEAAGSSPSAAKAAEPPAQLGGGCCGNHAPAKP